MMTTNLNKFIPVSSRHNAHRTTRHSPGENVLYNIESLCDVMDFSAGMKVLNLGSFRADSSIFLAREFDVRVWSVDKRTCPTSNFKRISELGCSEKILPLRLDARQLPFPAQFFDAILAVDSFMYFGTDLEFTEYVTNYIKPGGQIGIVDICYLQEESPPGYQSNGFIESNGKYNFVHSLKWWKDLWQSSSSLEVHAAEVVPENELIIKEYIEGCKLKGKNDLIAEELENDRDNALKIFRLAAVKQRS